MRYFSATTNVVWGLLFSFISPIFGLIFNLNLAFSRKGISHIGLAFSIVLIYSYLPIMWDARNNFARIYYYPEDGLNLYAKSLYVLTHKLNLSYILAYSTYSFFTVLIFSRVILGKMIERKDLPYTQYVICIALFLMCLEYRSISDLQKTTLAIAIGLLSLESKRMLKYFLATLSILIHPFVILLYFAIAIAKILSNFSRKYFVLMMISASLISFALSPSNLLPIANLLHQPWVKSLFT